MPQEDSAALGIPLLEKFFKLKINVNLDTLLQRQTTKHTLCASQSSKERLLTEITKPVDPNDERGWIYYIHNQVHPAPNRTPQLKLL